MSLIDWYVVHTKPQQEQRALLNLEQQGYTCFLPMFAAEKLRRGKLCVVEEPLFARYLFIRLDAGPAARGWSQIRSTRGVVGLVAFGSSPTKVSAQLIEHLHQQQQRWQSLPQRLFSPGELLTIGEGPFAGMEAIYRMESGEQRALLMIELMGKQVQVQLPVTSLHKTAL